MFAVWLFDAYFLIFDELFIADLLQPLGFIPR